MYKDDTPITLYDEFVVLENEIEKVGRNIKVLSIVESQCIAEYENLKNQELVNMFAEEVEKKFKRTEAQRIALYRTKYAALRLAPVSSLRRPKKRTGFTLGPRGQTTRYAIPEGHHGGRDGNERSPGVKINFTRVVK